jgi:hypothetical protein
MFSPNPDDFEWKTFVDFILDTRNEKVALQVNSDIHTTFGPFRWMGRLMSLCTVSLSAYREKMIKLGYSTSGNIPAFFQPTCDESSNGR